MSINTVFKGTLVRGRVSTVEFIAENNVEYQYLKKYSAMNPKIFNDGKKKLQIYYMEDFLAIRDIEDEKKHHLLDFLAFGTIHS